MRYWIVFILNLGVFPGLLGQNYILDTLEINSDRLRDFGRSSEVQVIDSALMQSLQSGSLASLLALEGGLMVQQYSPGQLASPSMRGTAAAHTAVLWHGVNLQSAQNGQVDLSLFPLSANDQLTIQRGGSSALWGSGAIGGSILLENRPNWEGHQQVHTQLELGQFGHYYGGANISLGKQEFYSNSRLFYRQTENDFYYLPRGSEVKQQQIHSANQQWGGMQDLYWKLNDRQQLSYHAWYQQSDREIPRSAQQYDQSFRQNLQWKYVGDRTYWKVNLAHLRDQLTYTDSMAGIVSNNLNLATIVEPEFNWQWKRWKGQVGLNLSHYEVQGGSLEQASLQQTRSAIFSSLQYETDRFHISGSLRQAWTDQLRIPLMPDLGVVWKILPNARFRARVNRSFRQPTFNDLYWNPGGNPDLLSESGWQAEAGTDWYWASQEFHLSLYQGRIENWIQWIPGPQFWFPQNLKDVRMRGVESRWKGQWQIQKLRIVSQLNYQFSQSQTMASDLVGDASIGKQLIFVPQHQMGLQLQFHYQNWYLLYLQRYTGKRFTASDNSLYLPAYTHGFVQLSRKWARANNTIDLYLRIDNLWNASYEVIPGRPMPLRSFVVGLNLHLKTSKSQ